MNSFLKSLVAVGGVLIASPLFADWTPKIVGGVDVLPGDPIAQSTVLILGKIGRGSFTCSGSIIDRDIVLTAGHCLGSTGYAFLTVEFKTDVNASGPEIQVIDQVRPDTYNTNDDPDTHWDDIALLKLASPIPSGYVPAKFLPDQSVLQSGTSVLLAGYGANVPVLTGDVDGVGVLRKVEQKILDTQYGPEEILVDIHDHGACFGDSGGPAFLSVDGTAYLFGVTSHLTEHDRLPNEGHQKHYGCLVDMVYTNALAHMDWIRATITAMHHSTFSWPSR